MNQKKYIAVIDLGSNSFNLIIARNEGIFRPVIKRFNITVQLARYLDENNLLAQEGIERCCHALSAIQEYLKPFAYNIEVRANATYTIRSCTNQTELLEAIAKVFPHDINIIAGETEAINIYRGICISNPIEKKFLAIDIGGGSTEIIFSENLQPVFCTSENLGCVSFSKKFFTEGMISKAAFKEAYNMACNVFAPIKEKAQELGFMYRDLAVGSSGTAKTVLMLIKSKFREVEKRLNFALERHNLSNKDANFIKKQLAVIEEFKAKNFDYNVITLDSLDYIVKLVSVYNHTQQLHAHGFDSAGREVLIGGLAILRAIFTTFGIKQMVYSDTALREGILYAEYDQHKLRNLKHDTLEALKNRYHVDPIILNDFTRITTSLAKANNLPYSEEQIYTFCLFNLLGMYIDDDSYSHHSQYIFRNSKLYGFSHHELSEINSSLSYYNSASTRRGGKLTALVLLMILANSFICSNFDYFVDNKLITVKYKNRNTLEVTMPKKIAEENTFITNTFARIPKKIQSQHLVINLQIKD